jgi:hypothetical protein
MVSMEGPIVGRRGTGDAAVSSAVDGTSRRHEVVARKGWEKVAAAERERERDKDQ